MPADRDKAMETVLFTRRPSQHANTQNERLLNNQDQDGRNQKAGKAVLRIEDGHGLIRNRIDRYFFLPGKFMMLFF